MGCSSVTHAIGRVARRPGCARGFPRLAAVRLFAGVALATLAGGCTPLDAGKTLTTIPDWAAFQKTVLKSKGAVLVEFSKDPCPPCVTQKGELDKLTGEFGTRIMFTTMTVMTGDYVVTEIRDRYHIFWLPTTVLFVNGEERKRWENVHGATEIREELKKVLLDPSVNQAPAGAGARKSTP